VVDGLEGSSPGPGEFSFDVEGVVAVGVDVVGLGGAEVDGGIVADGGFDVSTGTITLTYSNENQIAGSFDALFDDPNTGNPSELQGTFNVAYCP